MQIKVGCGTMKPKIKVIGIDGSERIIDHVFHEPVAMEIPHFKINYIYRFIHTIVCREDHYFLPFGRLFLEPSSFLLRDRRKQGAKLEGKYE